MRDSKGAARRKNTKPLGSAKRSHGPMARLQLHLGEQTVQRLNVHAALVGMNSSRCADEILTSYLARHGRGREIFPAPVDIDDRTDGASTISNPDES